MVEVLLVRDLDSWCICVVIVVEVIGGMVLKMSSLCFLLYISTQLKLAEIYGD